MRESSPEHGPDAAATVGTSAETTDEIARLRAERDAALAELSAYQGGAGRAVRQRQIWVSLLVVVFAILVPITTTVAWTHRTVMNTDSWVNAVAPVATDPTVTAALSVQITDQLYTALDPESRIAEVLPSEAAFLAGPIANGMKGRIQSAVNRLLDSDEFRQLWVAANRFAHPELVAVLRGDNEVLQTTDNQVVLNLVPLLADVLSQSEQMISGVIGRQVTLPAISGDELPSAACARIATALGRPVPSTCGQIVLFPADQLSNVERVTWAFDSLTPLLLIVTPLVAIAALGLSKRRRRTLLQLTVAGALALVVGRRLVMLTQDQLISAAAPENRAVRSAVLGSVLDGYFGVTGWMLFGAVVIMAVALVTGPYEWAAATRTATVTGVRQVGHALSAGESGKDTHSSDTAIIEWIRRHREVLQVGGIGVALLLLLVLDVSFWWMVIVLALVGLYEFLLMEMRAPSPGSESPRDLPNGGTEPPPTDR